MRTESQRRYVSLMEEIKHRANVIEHLGVIPDVLMYRPVYLESIALQLRMILENLAIACLIANGESLANMPKTILKEYNPEKLLKRLEEINPTCYPQPIVLNESASSKAAGLDPSQVDQFRGELIDRQDEDWLRREEISACYGRLGDLLHRKNPLRGEADLRYFERQLPAWYQQIVNLITHHKVGIAEEGKMYIVIVRHADDATAENPGAFVQLTEWVPLKPPHSASSADHPIC